MAATPEQFIARMDEFLGYRYKFGGEVTGSTPKDCDCSEAVQYACRNLGLGDVDGSGAQFDWMDGLGLRIPFEQAKNTPGACLYKSYSDEYPPGDRNDGGIYHIAVTKGPNLTTEVCCDDGDVIVNKVISGRSWYIYGTLVPGVEYSSTPEPTPPPTTDVPVSLSVEGGGTVSLRELRKGSEGRDVRQYQALLEEWAISPGTHDGQFGPATDSATRQFQQARGLTVDGIVGERTWGSALGR